MTHYLVPSSVLAQVIVLILILAGIFWFTHWSLTRAALHRARKRITDITPLLGPLCDYVRHTGDPDPETSADTPERMFRHWADTNSLAVTDPVVRHIEALFLAGCYDSRLDTAELSRLTQRAVAGKVLGLRLAAGLFVVGGLLGTLIGLSDAVRHFGTEQAPAAQPGAQADAARERVSQEVFQGLRGAFAPSVAGVFLSILAVLALVHLQTRDVDPFVGELQYYTQHVWTPRLFPTRSQRITEAAQRALSAANQVVQFAGSIESRSEELAANLTAAAKVAREIRESVALLNDGVQTANTKVQTSLTGLEAIVQRFSDSIGGWANFQERFTSLQSSAAMHLAEIAESAKSIRADAAQLPSAVAALRVASSNAHEPFEQAATEMKNAAGTFASTFETNLQQFQVKIDAALESRMTEFRDSNREMRELLASLTSSSSQRLEAVNRSLLGLGHPFEQAAKRMEEESSLIRRQQDTQIEWLVNYLHRERNLLEKVVEGMPAVSAGQQRSAEQQKVLTAIDNHLRHLDVSIDELLERKHRDGQPYPGDIIKTVPEPPRARGASASG